MPRRPMSCLWHWNQCMSSAVIGHLVFWGLSIIYHFHIGPSIDLKYHPATSSSVFWQWCFPEIVFLRLGSGGFGSWVMGGSWVEVALNGFPSNFNSRKCRKISGRHTWWIDTQFYDELVVVITAVCRLAYVTVWFWKSWLSYLSLQNKMHMNCLRNCMLSIFSKLKNNFWALNP